MLFKRGCGLILYSTNEKKFQELLKFPDKYYHITKSCSVDAADARWPVLWGRAIGTSRSLMARLQKPKHF